MNLPIYKTKRTINRSIHLMGKFKKLYQIKKANSPSYPIRRFEEVNKIINKQAFKCISLYLHHIYAHHLISVNRALGQNQTSTFKNKIKQTNKSNLQELNKTQIKIPVNYGAIKEMLTLTAFTETNITQHVGYLYI